MAKSTQRPMGIEEYHGLDRLRETAHPVDYLGKLRAVMGRLHDKSRLAAAEAEAVAAVLALGRDELYGHGRYATRVETPKGPEVEVHDIPHLSDVEGILAGRRMLVLDTETTGLNYRMGDRIIALGIWGVKMRGPIAYPAGGGQPYPPEGEGRIEISEPAWEWRFNPEGRPSTPEALAVHRIPDADLVQEKTFAAQAKAIHAMLHSDPGVVLVAHNAPFDLGFLDMEFARCGLPLLKGRVLDTRAVSKRLWPQESGSLDALAARLGVPPRERSRGHSAIADAFLLARCLPGLLDAVREDLDRFTAIEAAARASVKKKARK